MLRRLLAASLAAAVVATTLGSFPTGARAARHLRVIGAPTLATRNYRYGPFPLRRANDVANYYRGLSYNAQVVPNTLGGYFVDVYW